VTSRAELYDNDIGRPRVGRDKAGEQMRPPTQFIRSHLYYPSSICCFLAKIFSLPREAHPSEEAVEVLAVAGLERSDRTPFMEPSECWVIAAAIIIEDRIIG